MYMYGTHTPLRHVLDTGYVRWSRLVNTMVLVSARTRICIYELERASERASGIRSTHIDTHTHLFVSSLLIAAF